jgi:hypothetical protein
MVGIVVFLFPLCYMLIVISWPLFENAWKSGEMSQNAGGLIRWPMYGLIPLGFILLALAGSVRTDQTRRLHQPAPAPDVHQPHRNRSPRMKSATRSRNTPPTSRRKSADGIHRPELRAADVRRPAAVPPYRLSGGLRAGRHRAVLRLSRHGSRHCSRASLFQALPLRVFGIMQNDTLLAIPFFTFMGIILEKSGMAEDLLETIGQVFGPVRGGLALAVIFVGALLAATTGVVAAAVISMGLISLPIMLRNGYNRTIATGVITASGTLAQAIPPSLVLIVMADQLGRSVGDMYAGALVPGLLAGGLLRRIRGRHRHRQAGLGAGAAAGVAHLQGGQRLFRTQVAADPDADLGRRCGRRLEPGA